MKYTSLFHMFLLTSSLILGNSLIAHAHEDLASEVTGLIRKFVKGIKNGTITFDVDEKAVGNFVSHLKDEQVKHILGLNKRTRLEKKLQDLLPDVVKRIKKLIKHYSEDAKINEEHLEAINQVVKDIKSGSKKIVIPAQIPLTLALLLSHLPGPLVQAMFEMDIFNGK